MPKSRGMLSDQKHCSNWRSDNPDYYNSNIHLPVLPHHQHQQQHYAQVRSHGNASSAESDRVRRRINVACMRCRKRKIKCTGPIHDGVCQNCIEAAVEKNECQYHRVQSRTLDYDIPQLQSSSHPTVTSRAGSLGQVQEQAVTDQDYSSWTAECEVHSPTAREQGTSYIPFGYNDSVGQLGPRAGITAQSFPADVSSVHQSPHGRQATVPITSWSTAMHNHPAVSPMTSSVPSYSERQLPVPTSQQQHHHHQTEAFGTLTTENQTLGASSCRYGVPCNEPRFGSATELTSRYVGPYIAASRAAPAAPECPSSAMVQGYPSYMGTTEQGDLSRDGMLQSMPATHFHNASSDDHNGYAHASASDRAAELQMYGQMYDPPADPRLAGLDVLASTSAWAQNGLAVPAFNNNSSAWPNHHHKPPADTSGQRSTSKKHRNAR